MTRANASPDLLGGGVTALPKPRQPLRRSWTGGQCGWRFRTQLGLAPKAYARIVRFQRAVGLLGGVRDGHTLADVAIECGYYDQSHLSRDFVALAGCTPTALMAECTGEPEVRFLQDDGTVGSVPSVHDDTFSA